MFDCYFYHIRKTGGRAIIYAFMQNSEHRDYLDGGGCHPLYKRLCDSKILNIQGNTFVCHHKKYIESGNYHFGFSHMPQHGIHFQKPRITITCIREPVERFFSYYANMKRERERFKHSQAKYIDLPFIEFVRRVDRIHLLPTVYMFSKTFNVDEAFNNLMKVDHILYHDKLDEGLIGLGLTPPPLIGAINNKKFKATQQDLDELTVLLDPEIKLYEKIMKYRN